MSGRGYNTRATPSPPEVLPGTDGAALRSATASIQSKLQDFAATSNATVPLPGPVAVSKLATGAVVASPALADSAV